MNNDLLQTYKNSSIFTLPKKQKVLYNNVLMNLDRLSQLVKGAPRAPGVYVFGTQDHELYIGKAADIKQRISSYPKTQDHRLRTMISKAEKVEFIETGSDIEALILESQMIKNKRPPFNIMLRDDKQYFYVAFSNAEFPRLYLTHQTTGRIKNKIVDVKEYIGPFTDGTSLKATLKYLRSIFPYCTCKQSHHNFCLNHHIGKCIGYCCLKDVDPKLKSEKLAEYKQNIKAIRDILSGKKNSLVKELKGHMDQAARADKFDHAIDLRNKIERLQRVFDNAHVIKHSEILKAHRSGLQTLLKLKNPIIRIEGYDISNIQGTNATGSMVTFVHGRADKNFYRKFRIRTKKTPDDTAMLHEVLIRRFNHPEWPFPDLILIDGGRGQVNTAAKTLKDMGVNLPVVGISKDERHLGHKLIVPGRKTPIMLDKLSRDEKNLLLWIDTEAHRFAIKYYRHLHQKKNLKMA
ncbi:GIY-YIG nuclease family protein [Candidatus Parcubacteria bacterium]|nr:GIY-YIG nuclease family protein [Candidatus Parcubacteria bacterium]